MGKKLAGLVSWCLCFGVSSGEEVSWVSWCVCVCGHICVCVLECPVGKKLAGLVSWWFEPSQPLGMIVGLVDGKWSQ